MLRRSRGYVPDAADAADRGAHGRCSPAAPSRRRRSALPAAIGRGSDITSATSSNCATLTAYREGIGHFERMFAVKPELVAHDLHPDYLSTQYALELDDVELDRGPAPPRPSRGLPGRARRHHAGGRGDLRRNRLRRRRDRVGRGAAGRRPAWLRAGRMAVAGADARRRGRRSPAVADGGGVAGGGARAGCAVAEGARRDRLLRRLGRHRPDRPGRRAVTADVEHRSAVDAVGVLCGAPAQVSYEGQTAIELEALAWSAAAPAPGGGYAWRRDGSFVLDPRAAIVELTDDLRRGVPAAVVAGAVSRRSGGRDDRGGHGDRVGLRGRDSGPVRRRVPEPAAAGERRHGARPGRSAGAGPERLPPNDGGISFGQAAIAAAQ